MSSSPPALIFPKVEALQQPREAAQGLRGAGSNNPQDPAVTAMAVALVVASALGNAGRGSCRLGNAGRGSRLRIRSPRIFGELGRRRPAPVAKWHDVAVPGRSMAGFLAAGELRAQRASRFHRRQCGALNGRICIFLFGHSHFRVRGRAGPRARLRARAGGVRECSTVSCHE